jgi:hypothetical protein
MEDLKAQKKIIALGKVIVKELELDPGVDTLAKWMAHYIAEKIKTAERLKGEEKTYAENECYEAILKLWEHRWSIPTNKPFLNDFKLLFETLEKLNPENDRPFFYSPKIEIEIEKDKSGKDGEKVEGYFQAALRVDKLARSLISHLLKQAVSEIEFSKEREKLIRNFIYLVDYPDMRIIRITSNHNKSRENQDEDEKEERIKEIQKRIKSLEEFNSMKDYLLENLKKELAAINK